MSAPTQPRRPAGTPVGGQFDRGAGAGAAAALAIPDSKARQFVERMIASGRFSPAARDMDVREVIDQYSQAHAETFERTAAMYEAADVLMRGKPSDLAEGDLVDLEPLMREYGGNTVSGDDIDLASYELATVDGVTEETTERTVIWTDQMNLAIPANAMVDFRPNMEARCRDCGVALIDEGYDGRCYDCDPRDEDDTACVQCGAPAAMEDRSGHAYCDGCADDLAGPREPLIDRDEAGEQPAQGDDGGVGTEHHYADPKPAEGFYLVDSGSGTWRGPFDSEESAEDHALDQHLHPGWGVSEEREP